MGSLLNEALIGREVEAHFADGSVASGILSTVSFDSGFGIVLENARMIKQGGFKRNVVFGGRLVISSGDLVKVVPKAAQIPSVREVFSSVGHPISRISLQKETRCVPKNAKPEESKLNPGAKLFRPSARKPIPPNSGVHYTPNTTSRPEVGGQSPFGSHSHFPVTYFSQPIVGHLGSRAQPLNAPMGLGFVHPPSQSVMVGQQPGQVIYLHPPSHEVITPLPSAFLRPFPTPHPTQFLKHQGALMPQPPYCVAAPPLMATVQQQPQQAYSIPYNVPILEQQQRAYSMPYNVPILEQQRAYLVPQNVPILQQQQTGCLMPQNVQQPFPSNRYLQLPGPNNALFNTKFI